MNPEGPSDSLPLFGGFKTHNPLRRPVHPAISTPIYEITCDPHPDGVAGSEPKLDASKGTWQPPGGIPSRGRRR
jgi:hypothetical protein